MGSGEQNIFSDSIISTCPSLPVYRGTLAETLPTRVSLRHPLSPIIKLSWALWRT